MVIYPRRTSTCFLCGRRSPTERGAHDFRVHEIDALVASPLPSSPTDVRCVRETPRKRVITIDFGDHEDWWTRWFGHIIRACGVRTRTECRSRRLFGYRDCPDDRGFALHSIMHADWHRACRSLRRSHASGAELVVAVRRVPARSSSFRVFVMGARKEGDDECDNHAASDQAKG